MEHTKGILLECNLSEEEINTVIEALSRDYIENDPETLEKEYQLQGKLRELTPDQLELETLVFIRDKEKFISVQSGLFYVTEFDEYDQDLETDQPYFTL